MGKQENRQTNQFPGKGKAEGENLMKNEKNYFEFFFKFLLDFYRNNFVANLTVTKKLTGNTRRKGETS